MEMLEGSGAEGADSCEGDEHSSGESSSDDTISHSDSDSVPAPTAAVPKSTAKPAPTAAAPKSTAKPAPKAATPNSTTYAARSEGYCGSPRIRLKEDIGKKGNEESEEAANYR